ncbi:putative coiled-coil flagellar protein [Histomonas meleagridis]|uniref:putative coiled-coil flagellar protein n=1 Tax=Histomonas meleagridis TaxID=135588 RepID=UPI0035595824|nr:putative coiled-coil flagellar protein [Histomonas meleagridis]KAH0796132.1 putative coiled-coil flagellar protein [Histomonas meleagridis]
MTEQILLRRTRDLNKELKAQKMTIEDSTSQQQDHHATLTLLRQLVTNAQTELDAAKEQIESIRANTALKKKERDKLIEKVAQAKEDQSLKLEPLKLQISNEVQALEESIKEKTQTVNNLKNTSQSIANRLQICEEQIADIESKKKVANQKMLEIGSIPIKTRQKVFVVESSHNSLLSEEKSIVEQLNSTETTLTHLHSQSLELETEYQNISNEIEQMIKVVNNIKLKNEEIRQLNEEQNNIKQQKEYEVHQVIKLVNEQNSEITTLEQKLETIEKDINKKEKEKHRIEEAITKLQIDTKNLNSQLDALKTEEQKEELNNSQLKTQLDKSIEAKESALRAVLSVKNINEKILEEIKSALIERNRKQTIHDELAKKEHELQLQLTEMSLIRDRKARETASMKKKTIDTKALAMERNLDLMDLHRKQEQNSQKLKDCSELYEKAKIDRNKNLNHIQSSRQYIVEYKEKIRILENEVDFLRNEFEQVDASVKLQKNSLLEALTRRDSTKSDLKKAEKLYQELQSKIDLQHNEIERLNLILQNRENAITHQQSRYTVQADDCSNMRRMLIDKQDELYLIHEQFNRHEEVMKRGEIALKEREEEQKLLSLQLKDFVRRIEIMQKKIPQLKAYENEISELEKQIVKERSEVEKVTEKLEIPDLKGRKRIYCGKDYTQKELDEKVKLYEQRINEKSQQIWEKQILLNDIEEKIKEIKENQQNINTQRSSKTHEKSENFRVETMALRRKKMAALAESAIYQAQSEELKEQKENIKAEIEMAGKRTQKGEAFDQYAEKMVKMHIRDANSSLRARTANIDGDELDEKRNKRQHFDAYPTADGLSRPYGAFPVFQPAEPSGQLRHYRNENVRPIEI